MRGTPLRLLRSIRRIVLALAILFAVFVGMLWLLQERLVFVPPPTPVQQGRNATRVDFVSADGQPLFGFLVSAKSPQSPMVPPRMILHFHGNGDLADSWIDWARELAERTGWSVFLAEYRGYGGLPGRPTFDGVMRDARAALTLLQTEYGLAPDQIVLYGHSLGTGVATQLAVERGARAVVLEAPITSVVDVGRQNLGPPLSMVLPLISRIHLTPLEDVRRIQVPVFVVSGGRDEVAPAKMGRRVFDAAARKGEYLLVAGGQHGDLSRRGGERYWELVQNALGLNTSPRPNNNQ